MSIFPLPVFETDADPHHRSEMTDEELRAGIEPPKSIIVRFGYTGMIGQCSFDGEVSPPCGARLIARTHRGTELVNMLATARDDNAGSGTISSESIEKFIESSGGKDFPFHSEGQILRVATVEDMNKHAAIESGKPQYLSACEKLIEELNLTMNLVDVEPILGGELLTFFYMAEERVDFRELVRRLASSFKTSIEMRQVGARDEARLVADYERCGQYCCCKNFLKVLRPISMKSAKLQKATLDPLKISGRCGRLMCCLRYEDETYRELKTRLPRKQTRVGTAEGPGIVIDGKVLVQLALVRLEHDQREIAVPVDELMDPEQCPEPGEMQRLAEEQEAARLAQEYQPEPAREEKQRDDQARPKRSRRRRKREKKPADQAVAKSPGKSGAAAKPVASDQPKSKRKRDGRRRRSRRKGPGGQPRPKGDGRAKDDGGSGR